MYFITLSHMYIGGITISVWNKLFYNKWIKLSRYSLTDFGKLPIQCMQGSMRRCKCIRQSSVEMRLCEAKS